PVLGAPPEARFIMDTIGYFVEAVNTSINSTHYVWTTGDGTVLENEQYNILHDYNSSGIYELCLTAFNECGEDVFCRTVTIVGDAEEVTEIGGEVMTENRVPIGNVIVNCTDMGDINTKFDGLYAFGSVPMGNSYTIRPSKEDNLAGGLSTYDVFLIRQHVLGSIPFDSPYKIIAADLDNSGSVTVFDEVILRQLLLGMITELPNGNTPWRFVDASFEFPNPNNPWEIPFPEEIVVNSLEGIIDDANFIGIKIGDVNGSIISNGLVEISNRNTDKTWLKQEINTSTRELHLSLPDGLLGAQFTLAFNADLVDVESIELGDFEAQYFNLTKVEKGQITVSWNNSKVNLQGGLLLKMQLQQMPLQKEIFRITNDKIRAEAYVAKHGIAMTQDIVIQQTTVLETNVLEVYQNVPNPFQETTTIPFSTGANESVTLSIFDLSGRMLSTETRAFERGKNTWNITRANLPIGVLYYRIATAKETVTRKMLLLE
ncbi:MAG: T9SS type A sorting domain-containing protein, partial [Bacteroidota bacterium]